MASRSVLSTRYRVWVISFPFLILLTSYIWLFAWENFWDLSLYQIFFWASGITFVIMATNWFHLYYLYGFRLVGWGFVRFFWICYSRLIVSILLTALFVGPLSVNAILVTVFFLVTSFVSYILIYQETKRAFYLEESERKKEIKRRQQELGEEEKRLNIWRDHQKDQSNHLWQRQQEITRQNEEMKERELENKKQLSASVLRTMLAEQSKVQNLSDHSQSNSLHIYGSHPYLVYSHLRLEELERLSKQCPDADKRLNCTAILYLACSIKLEEVSSLLEVYQEDLIKLLHRYNGIGSSELGTFVLRRWLLLESDNSDISFLLSQNPQEDCFPPQSVQATRLNAARAAEAQVQSGKNILLDGLNLSDTTQTHDQTYIPKQISY